MQVQWKAELEPEAEQFEQWRRQNRWQRPFLPSSSSHSLTYSIWLIKHLFFTFLLPRTTLVDRETQSFCCSAAAASRVMQFREHFRARGRELLYRHLFVRSWKLTLKLLKTWAELLLRWSWNDAAAAEKTDKSFASFCFFRNSTGNRVCWVSNN